MMPFIIEVLPFADSRDVGLNWLAALVSERANRSIAPAVLSDRVSGDSFASQSGDENMDFRRDF
jgi:hypothetical protein